MRVTALVELAGLEASRGNLAEARRLEEEALAEAESWLPEDHVVRREVRAGPAATVAIP